MTQWFLRLVWNNKAVITRLSYKRGGRKAGFHCIPKEEGITTICHAYDTFYTATPPIPTHYLRAMLRLILQENSFQFNGKDFLQTHGTALGTKTAVSFPNIFMAKIETAVVDQHSTRPLLWKRYIDDVFSLWDTNREEIRGRPFNSWGGGGVGDFEKKFPASACRKKKIACSTNVIEKISCPPDC